VNLVLFYVLGGIILLSAILVVSLRNVFHSALFLVLAFFIVGGVYLLLGAEFLAAVQVLIYVGAITILILFAIMLTYQIQSKSIRQTNEQGVPAVIISIIFFALTSFALIKTFGKFESPTNNIGYWTAYIDTSKLPQGPAGLPQETKWSWTVSMEDAQGQNYIASGAFTLSQQKLARVSRAINRPDPVKGSGFIISGNSDFSTMERIFGKGRTIYITIWSDKLNYGSVSKAEWVILSPDASQSIVRKLTNSNTDIIGRLLLSKYVLPFEVVSVLLLAALIGAIVIARKDK